MTFRCNKGELGDCEEGIPIVTACTLVNMYADKSRNNIHVHYIATKLYYKGSGYATYLLYDLCRSGGLRTGTIIYPLFFTMNCYLTPTRSTPSVLNQETHVLKPDIL